MHFYFKEEEADTTEWVLIDSCFVGPIEPWCSDTASVTWRGLGALPGAWYDIQAVADPLGDLHEAYEDNNVASTKVPIGVSLEGFPAPLPGVPVTSPTVTSFLAYGQRKPYAIICIEGGTVNAISSRGRCVGSYRTRAMPIFSVAVGDLCGNGGALQVVASGDSLRAIDIFTTQPTKWVLALPNNSVVATSPSLADLDFDEEHDLEIALGAITGTSSQVYAINCWGDSAVVFWSQALGDTGVVGVPVDPILVVNLDDEGGDDIVVSTTHGLLYALDGQTGRIFSSADIAPSDALPASNPVSADIDLDGYAEVICGSSLIAVYQADTLLTLKARALLSNESALYVSTGNIDPLGDPDREIVLATTSRLVVLDYDPSQIPELQERAQFPTTHPVHTMPAIGDVKWNTGPEIVFASGDSLYILSSDCIVLTRKPLNGTISSSPCLTDITGDGFPEIIVGAAGSLEAIGGTGQTRNVEWQMFGSDIHHRSVRSAVLSHSITTDRVLWGKNTIIGDATIAQATTVIIEPGAIVEFTPGPGVPRGEMRLRVEGDLILNATADQPVTFTSGYFDKSRGDWDAIELYGSGPLEVKYCSFEYAYQALRCLGRSPSIQYCSFSECADCGIYVDNDNPRIASCSFERNRCDISLLCAAALIESCSFERQDVCGLSCWADNGSIVTGNSFIGSGCHGWAIYIYEILSPLVITGNWIQGYGSRGILSDGAYQSSCKIHHNVVRFVGGPGMEFNESSYPQEHWGRAFLDSNIVFRCAYGIWSDATNNWDYPVLQKAGNDSGFNSIKESIYEDAVNTCPWLRIPAKGNWWDFDCSNPDSVAKHLEGPFDIDPCLDSDPYADIELAPYPAGSIALRQNAPNPFDHTTKIRFVLSTPCRVRLSVYNVRGQLVKVLFDRTTQEGEHTILWDGTAESGSRVSPGIYFYVLSTPMGTQRKKIVLLK